LLEQQARPAQTEAPKASAAEASAKTPQPTPAQSSKPLRPRRYNFGPRKATIKLSPSAVSHLQNLLNQPEPKLIRIGTKAKGCSGLAYHLEYVDKPSALDEQVEQDGVKVLIDNKALLNIIGSEMDWLEDKLNERFVFKNPNISEMIPSMFLTFRITLTFFTAEQCGCGESFSVG
jgi:iron-sulfur cluster assembly protein